jgi:hypothetical protein
VLRLQDAVVSDVPTDLSGPMQLYAQVDWVDSGTPGIGVVNEGASGEANNVAGANGAACSATAGLPDLIVDSIQVVNVTSSGQPAAATATSLPEGVEAAPDRPSPAKP